MNEESISPRDLSRLGLTQEEYSQIKKLLERTPNRLELSIFSAMWSEHCSYKSSRVHLKKFPTTGRRVIQGPGENAGVVDIGEGWVAVFKMESHNHPSFIEPYQGAATGVGGILRDIFTMGARPVALLNSLRLGPLSVEKNRTLFEGIVSGIAGYGNCIGVPTVGGEVAFHEIYSRNPLVNVFCLGIARKDEIVKGLARGIGNLVIYLGSKTGRDGIHGATMASESFDHEAESKRPTVQVGDPFLGKLLLEACLEMIGSWLIEGIQDMGAAGLTSSSVEMANRAGTGIEIDISRVPCREKEMEPYEVMLSESQERMLLVATPDKKDAILKVCQKWDLEGTVIGRVTEDGCLRLRAEGREVGVIPIRALTEDAPVYRRPLKEPGYLGEIQSLQVDLISQPSDYGKVLIDLLKSPTIASKDWVYEQFDHMVRTDTVVLPGADAAVLRMKESQSLLAITVDGNSSYTLLNPYQGGMIAVCEAVRNLVCVGAKPVGLTDCLNFGNPERPDVMWQFAAAIEGISDVCRHLEIPVVSGNVSFYNETSDVGIYPTPIIGMVGLIPDIQYVTTPWFKSEGDVVVLLGRNLEELGGSEYLRSIHQREGGYPPSIDLSREKALHECCLEGIETGIINSAHDCSEGGLAVTLSESCMTSPSGKNLGVAVELKGVGIRNDAVLFGESQSRIILSVGPGNLESLQKIADSRNVPMTLIGKVGGQRLLIKQDDQWLVDLPVEELQTAWRGSMRTLMHGEIRV